MRNKGFWIDLIGLSAAVACALALALAVISATTALALPAREMPSAVGADDAASRPKTFTGVVTDTSCRARHPASDKNAAECTRECVKKGARYALVAGDNVYTLDGDADEVNRLSGQRVQVEGILEGRVVTVNSIALAQ
jgi:hypothetical protein